MVVLNGFSGSVDSYNAIDAVIEALDVYKGNCYRIAFNPPWTTGSRPWHATSTYGPRGIDKINHFLANCDHYIIVDRIHDTDNSSMPQTGPTGGADRNWQNVEWLLFNDVLANWGHNPRVIIEIINEYPNSEMYSICEGITQRIKAAGYTNLILNNKHNIAYDWGNFASLNPTLDIYGKHWYFNNMNNYTYYSEFINHMEMALAAGCIPMCNTEVGADYGERWSFTEEKVSLLNDALHWCNHRGIGNLIWMNHNLNNLYPPDGAPRLYEQMLNPDWGLQLPRFRLNYRSEPVGVDAEVNGLPLSSGGLMEFTQGDLARLKMPRRVTL